MSTHHSSKGLEADAVILIVDKSEFDNYMEAPEGDRANNILYVLATRAKKKLYILFTFEEDN
ncbi:MAG: ATP-binding domain-containing protein [Caldicoprobacterales bacterium]